MEKAFYSPKEFAAELGVSRATIYRAIKNGKINVIRPGGIKKSTIRIPHSEIERLGIVNLNELLQRIAKEQAKIKEA